jgi:hypothetical protein
MKNFLLTLLAVAGFQTLMAQITITASDMPVAGDTLRYSFASPTTSTINLGDTGANFNWHYDFTPTGQAVDSYLTAAQVNLLYAALIGPSAAGYKVADSFPIPGGFLPISIQQVYTFFLVKNSPSRYETKAFAANISGIPTPINYTTPDVWYFFPLNYLNTDSANYKLNISLPTLGSLKQGGVRISHVDGWGTITTPYYATPVNCIRIRSEIHEIDSLSFGTFPAIGFPRNSVEYKWLVNGDHYPALWVTTTLAPGGTETITSIRYRDRYRDSSTNDKVNDVHAAVVVISAHPTPAANGRITLEIPAAWQHFTVEVYDLQSKLVRTCTDQKDLDLSSLPAGNYVGRVTSGANTGYVKIIR